MKLSDIPAEMADESRAWFAHRKFPHHLEMYVVHQHKLFGWNVNSEMPSTYHGWDRKHGWVAFRMYRLGTEIELPE